MERIRSPIIVTVGHIDHGKCLHGDEKVILSTGEIVKISSLFEGKEIKNSDEYLYIEKEVPVLTCNGMEIKIAKATKVWKVKSSGYLYEVKLKNGRKIRVTPEHPFLTLEGWKKCEDLKEGDKIAVPLFLPINPPLNEWKKMLMTKLLQSDFLFRLKPKILKKLKNLTEIPRKNSFRKEDLEKIMLKLKLSPEKMLNYIKEIRCSNREKWISLPSDWSKFFYFLGFMFGSENSNLRRVTKNFRFKLKKELCKEIFEFSKKGKIPKLVMCAPNKYLANFIRGILDSCGSNYLESSSEFLEDLGILLLRLGITSTIYSKGKHTVLRISEKDNIGVSRSIKDIGFVEIVSKKKIRFNGFVYDLSVPPTQNFIANGIIVHNTTLLDSIRGTAVTKLEPGEMTQHVGASYIPTTLIKRICGNLLEKFKINLEIPGLLFIDTPGHSAFIGIRKRVGPLADLAILVVDINEGFQEQTIESLKILKTFKIPFVVAATKIDKITNWKPNYGYCFLDTIKEQKRETIEELDSKLYKIVSELSNYGFDSERFDRITDFTKQISIVPLSSVTKEGIQELLLVLSGLAQRFLKNKLNISEETRGSILEVKEIKGLGKVFDCILYDGVLKKGSYLVISGKDIVVTKVRAIMIPETIQDIRAEKRFKYVDEVVAASGIRLICTETENIFAGSSFISIENLENLEEAKKKLSKEFEEIVFSKDINGISIFAESLGSLEAMIRILEEEKIQIRKADLGLPKKDDLIEIQKINEDEKKVVLLFNIEPTEEFLKMAKDFGIKVFHEKVIYRLIENYKEYVKNIKEERIKRILETVNRPAKIKVLRGCVFRRSEPCIVGVEILKGFLKKGSVLKREDGKIVGKIKDIQIEGRSIEFAKTKDRVAISIEGAVFDRSFKEEDILFVDISSEDLEKLKIVYDYLTEEEKELLK